MGCSKLKIYLGVHYLEQFVACSQMIPGELNYLYHLTFYMQDNNHNRPATKKTNDHLQAFLTTVRSLGVSLRVYKDKEKWGWTSLLGGEKRLLLQKLPDLFDKFLPPEKVQKTKQWWNVSQTLN